MGAQLQSELSFLSGGGEMGERIRRADWSKTPLGPAQHWPKSLRTCVRIILTSRQPMFVWWGRDLINLYNDAYKAIVGGKHPEALGQPASLVWREIWDQVGPRAESAIRNNSGTYDEALLLIMERNGYREETYYTFSYSPVPNDEDTTGGLICANTDDTQRIIGERQLAALRELAANMVGSRDAADAFLRGAQALETDRRDLPFALIYSVDADEKTAVLQSRSGIADGHPAAPRTLDLTSPAFAHARLALRSQQAQIVDNLTALYRELPRGPWDKAPTQAAVVPIPRSGQTGRAGLLVAALNPYRLFDDGYRRFLDLLAGQIAGSVATAEAYEAERLRAEALAEIDRAKTAFFSNVSHEFRTPLTLLLGPLEDALRSREQTLAGQNLDTAYRNALRLLKLVNTLLDFSRIEAGRAQATFEPTDLAALTADLASAFRSAFERAGLRFEVSCPPLPEVIFVDHDLWEKIVLNLLSNALKYTFEGSVSIGLVWQDGAAVLSVTDTGTGIPHGELPHLFKRFHRVQGSRARTHEGTGIGLALVHELVRLHGGRISVESQIDRGTRFSIRIPGGRAHLPSAQIAAPRPMSSTATGAAPYVQEAFRWLPECEDDAANDVHEGNFPAADPDIRIMVVDDNADMRSYVSRLLRERWAVVEVADGARALEAALEEPPDLLLTDVMMPQLDGFGLLRALREDERTKTVPVIVLSARAGEEARVEGLEAGADDYLVKPFAARELLARVSTHLQFAQLRAEALDHQRRLQRLLMQAPVAVAVLSGPELRYELANPLYCAIVERPNLVGMAMREAFPELSAHSAIEQLEEAFRSGQPLHVSEQSIPVVRNGATGEGIFSYVAQPIFDDSGKPDALIIAAAEVTESVLARRRLDQLRAAAEQANRAKDEFLSTLSHELRTPLNAMVGWSSLLRAGSVPMNQRDRALEAIERNARVQARLIEDMLDLSRIEQGKLVLSVGPLELVRVMEAALDAVRPAAQAKQIALDPVLDSEATILGDPDRLQQVVWNLLSNAIKFTARGGSVRVALSRKQSHVEILVSDDGQGIAPEFLPHVFDRFRQGDPSYTRTAGGLGLGLTIVRSLVELHGGEVTAHSEGTDQGATFVVRLPLAPLRPPAPARPSWPPPGVAAPPSLDRPPSLEGMRLLIVDDEPETRELLKFVIEECSACVVTAATAEEAFAALQQDAFDLLISDVGMPGEDGYSLIRRVRSLGGAGAALPALALTAYARSEDRTQSLRAGFNMHLAKPIDPAELLLVIETLARTARRARNSSRPPS
jgi:signal transduction histidine kinase/DNA-binding response OmpR family regulator